MALRTTSLTYNRCLMDVRTKRVFERNDVVEVCSKEKGFLGSYYAARVIANMGDNYVVEHKDLLEDDKYGTPLRETVMANEIRPRPPGQIRPSEPKECLNKKFRLFDVVDVFANDGWWVGTITGKSKSQYSVFFKTTGDHIAYPVTHLRPHLVWRHGKWSNHKKDKRFFKEYQYIISSEVVKRVFQETQEDDDQNHHQRSYDQVSTQEKTPALSRIQEDQEKKRYNTIIRLKVKSLVYAV